MALPELVVIGAMKCGTSALHQHLDAHPEVAMASGKELNFFFGPGRPPGGPSEEWWRNGQWHRGQEWYEAQFDPAARVRGESSPGYTDPAHPEVPQRMRALVPDVRLIYLVRDPFDRAASQWRHHVADGTEPRRVEVALLDEESQYVARSRYLERVRGFVDRFRRDQLLVVVQERLRANPRATMRAVFAHAGVDPGFWHPNLATQVHVGRAEADDIPGWLRPAFDERVADDVGALRDYTGDRLAEWSPTTEASTSSQRLRNAGRP